MRRSLVCLFTIGLLIGAVVAAGAEGVPEETFELTLGHDGAIGSFQDEAVNKIAEVAKEKSGGRLIINVFPAGQLGSNMSMLESTVLGSQDLWWGDLTWLGNLVKDYQILSMGYAFRDQDHMNAFMDSEIGQQLKAQLLDEGILLIREHANQLPRVLVTKFPVSGPADLKGVKMRVPGIPIFVKVWEAMGTKPTSVNWGEVYLALSQGVVDAMECGYEFVYANKFYEVAKYVTRNDHVRGIRGMLANPAKHARLPEDLQDVLLEASIAGEKLYNERTAQAEAEHTKLLKENGVTITTVDIAPFQKQVLSAVEKLEAEGMWSKGLFAKVQEIK